MAVRMGELDARQLERVRAELGELILGRLAYPPFFDFRANQLRMRPLDQAKRDEVALFVNSINFSPLDYTDVSSAEVRRFIERALLRYTEINPALTQAHQARRATELRAAIPQLAAEFQRSMQAFLNGAAPSFGGRRPTPLWSTAVANDSRLPPEERVHNTRVLEAILLRMDSPSGALTTTPVAAAAGMNSGGLASAVPTHAQHGALHEALAPFARPDASQPPGVGRVVNAAPAHATAATGGAQPISSLPTAPPAMPAPLAPLPDQPTGPLRSVRPGASDDSWLLQSGADRRANHARQGQNGNGRELPSDLYHLYSDYLLDMQPDAPLVESPLAPNLPQFPPTSAGRMGAASPAREESETPPPFWRVGAGSMPPANPAQQPTSAKPASGALHTPVAPAQPPAPAPRTAPQPPPPMSAPQAAPARDAEAARNDQLIFWQLRYQLEAYVRRAAHSYGVQHGGDDPASVLDALRRSGFVDEADLRIAEGIFALTDRVTARGYARIDDYQEALMLYLLYHRSHLRN